MIQTRSVAALLAARGIEAEIVGIATRGDREANVSLSAIGGDGIFVKELEFALLDGRADAAVHSLKDLPTELAPSVTIAAVLEREDARDVLVSRANAYASLAALPPGTVVGTSSLRRRAMLLAARPDVNVQEMRGNVDTRIRKVLEGRYGAAILALAGVKRLGLLASVGGGAVLALQEMIPPAGQGAICVQCRADDVAAIAALEPLNHPPTAAATAMERALLHRMGGGCLVPIGVHADIRNGTWRLDVAVAEVDGSAIVRRSASGDFRREAEAVAAAEALADEVLNSGARRIIDRFRTASARKE